MAAALLSLVLLTFAAARVTRVVVSDKIGEPLRTIAVRRLGAEHLLAYFVHCRWCTGLWVSLPAAAVAWWASPLGDAVRVSWWWGWPATALAMSYTIGLLVRAEPED